MHLYKRVFQSFLFAELCLEQLLFCDLPADKQAY